MRGHPLERREPAGARRRGDENHGPGPPRPRRRRRDSPGAPGGRPRRPRGDRRGTGRGAAPPRAPAPQDQDRKAPQTTGGEVPFDGCAERENELTAVVEVRFKGNRKEYFAWSSEEPLALHDPVIVEVERGQDWGRVSALGDVAVRKCGAGCKGCSLAEAVAPAAPAAAPERRIVRRATPDDARLADQLHGEEEDVRRKVVERLKQHVFPMKVS